MPARVIKKRQIEFYYTVRIQTNRHYMISLYEKKRKIKERKIIVCVFSKKRNTFRDDYAICCKQL